MYLQHIDDHNRSHYNVHEDESGDSDEWRKKGEGNDDNGNENEENEEIEEDEPTVLKW